MRKRTVHGLAIMFSVVSLGAAQGPIKSGTAKSQQAANHAGSSTTQEGLMQNRIKLGQPPGTEATLTARPQPAASLITCTI